MCGILLLCEEKMQVKALLILEIKSDVSTMLSSLGKISDCFCYRVQVKDVKFKTLHAQTKERVQG